MHDVNLTVFDFDYDLTWWAFFIDANERVYSRFGGTDDGNPASRITVAALKDTMRLVLSEHKLHGNEPPPPPAKVVRPVDLFGMKGKCMHCHQVNDNFYKVAKPKAYELDKLRFLVPPETLGLTMNNDAGNRVAKVVKDSPAEKAGLRADDVLRRVNGINTLSQGDVMWALKSAPNQGRLPVLFARNGKEQEVVVELLAGWKKVDLAWRRSVSKLKK